MGKCTAKRRAGAALTSHGWHAARVRQTRTTTVRDSGVIAEGEGVPDAPQVGGRCVELKSWTASSATTRTSASPALAAVLELATEAHGSGPVVRITGRPRPVPSVFPKPPPVDSPQSGE